MMLLISERLSRPPLATILVFIREAFADFITMASLGDPTVDAVGITNSDFSNHKWGNTLPAESVQELARNQLHNIPERYIRPYADRPSSILHTPQSTIPVVDMQKLLSPSSDERQQQMDLLSDACQEWGFFQVVNHGIPNSLIDRIRGVSTEFFSLPLEEKQKYAPQAGDVQGYGKTFVVDEHQTLDWGDLMALSIMPDSLKNLKLWPTRPSDFRDTVERYGAEVERVAKVILSLFAENLQLKGDYFKEKFGSEPMMTMRMNLYPPCPRPDLVLGLSSHSDGGGVTLLLQDDETQGLHVRNNGQWIPVQPIPYALVVNIGDMVEVMTNGRYKSIEHRAVTNKQKGRVSIAFFYYPATDAEVGPAVRLVDEEHPCLYRTFVHEDYIRYYLSKPLNGKHRLADFAKINDH